MATIEEILEANERPIAQVQSNIKYKEILTPAVMSFIVFANNQFQIAEDESGFRGLIQHLKLVIAGGAAFNYYIKNVEKMKILETHDFDLRLYLDIPPSRSPLFGNKAEKVEEWMTGICREIGNSFADFLNNYVKSGNIKKDLQNQNIDVSEFRMVDHGFLTTVEYVMSVDKGDEFVDSLVDIVPHVHSKAIHYGKLEIDKELNFEQYNEKNFGGVQSRQGFFKSSLVYIKTKYGVYYTSLGFLVWDTVRMLNYMVDARFFGFRKRKNRPDWDPTEKFERYLYKYKALLTALSKPDLYLKCEAFDKFVNKCNKTKQVCKINGKKIKTKEDIIYEGVNEGLFPNDIHWYKELMKMDFSVLCKSVVEG
jgi:hypothetical protein